MKPILGAILLAAVLPAPARAVQAAQAVADSGVYHVTRGSRLVVKTGKAGLFGFAGHTHVIRARELSGTLVYRPGRAASSLRLTVPTDRLEVLTPPDTAEIRKVTQAMRTEVLHTDRFPEMKFGADSLEARNGPMPLQLAVTMEGATRQVPVKAQVAIGGDTIRATGSFVVKQTDFGIKPFKGGPAGTVKVADQVTLCFDLVAVREGRGASGHEATAEEATTVPGCVDRSGPGPAAARRPM